MYVAKLNDLYLKKIELISYFNGEIAIEGKFTNNFRRAALFDNLNDKKRINILKENGFKFYKLSENEVNE